MSHTKANRRFNEDSTMQALNLVSFLISNKNMVMTAELTAKTVVKLNKRGNPFALVTKTKTTLITINGDYQESVNVQRLIESENDNFKALKPVWGENLTKSLVKHNENFYLQIIENGSKGSTVYHDQDGNVIKYEDFAAFKPASSSSSRQDVEDTVIVKKYKLDSIQQIVIRSPLVLVFKLAD